jgi:hypothetical protein
VELYHCLCRTKRRKICFALFFFSNIITLGRLACLRISSYQPELCYYLGQLITVKPPHNYVYIRSYIVHEVLTASCATYKHLDRIRLTCCWSNGHMLTGVGEGPFFAVTQQVQFKTSFYFTDSLNSDVHTFKGMLIYFRNAPFVSSTSRLYSGLKPI